jgi:diguanylate cyclase (GGDEF)-like protein/PAS domain S-box-containing protein
MAPPRGPGAERVAAICEAAPDATVVVAADGAVMWANRAAERLIGVPRDDVIGTSALDLIHPDDVEMASLSLGSMQAKETGTLLEIRVRTPGGWRLTEVVGTNRLDDPDVAGLILGVRDLTDRRRWELVSGEAGRLRSLVHNAASIFLLLDGQARVTSVSASVTRLLGLDPEQLEGRPLSDIVHPADRARFDGICAAVRDAPDGAAGAVNAVVRLRRPLRSDHVPYELVLVNLLEDPTAEGIVVSGHDVSELHEAQRALEELATRDPLTNLLNRRAILERADDVLVGAARDGAGACVLLMDVDRFKEVNDSLGHDAGDRVLAELAQRLRGCLRESDHVGRLGGDEFAVVLAPCRPEQAVLLAERIAEVFDRPIHVDSKILYVGVSIGIAEATGPTSDTATLMKQADIAMYRAKRQRSGNAFYGPDDDAGHLERLAMAAALRQALDGPTLQHQGLRVVYQPVIDLASGAPVALEALARWDRPGHGPVDPGEFIPLAERVGLIRPLTERILDQAVADCAFWLGEGFDVAVSVNLSPELTADSELTTYIDDVLRRHRVPHRCLTLEIVESAFSVEGARALDNLGQLRRRGVPLAIDDFGTGYSSFSRLRHVPVDQLKIDKSFVVELSRDERLRGMVQAICQLAASLSLSVVAEGVEDAGTLAEVRAMGCHYAQGFHLAVPMAVTEAMAWLAAAPALRTGPLAADARSGTDGGLRATGSNPEAAASAS